MIVPDLVPFARNAYPVLCECGAMLLSTRPEDRGTTLAHVEHSERMEWMHR